MTQDQIILIVIGCILIVLGATGVMGRTRRGQRWANLLGPIWSRLLYVILGAVALVISLVVL